MSRAAAIVVVASCALAVLAGFVPSGLQQSDASDSAALISSSTPAVSYTEEEYELVRLINEYRSVNGLETLLVSDICSEASTKHSSDMGRYGFFSHSTVASDWFEVGSNALERMVSCGYPPYTGWGENMAAGYASAATVFAAWKDSDVHRGHMLGPLWRVIGVGAEHASDSEWGWYWTVDFGDYLDGTAHLPGSSAPADTVAPTVTITDPRADADVSGRVTVEVSAADNLAVIVVDLYADGAKLGSDDTAPYVFTWDTSGEDPGSHTLEARAADAAGNVGTAQLGIHVTPGLSSTTTTTTAPPTTTTTVPPTTTTTTSPAVVFGDVKPSHPFYEAIVGLAELGVVSGSNGLFHPDALVTRAQFAKIIVLALGRHTETIDNAADPTFSDVPYTGASYPFDFVEEATALGIIQGRKDGTFGPVANVTRAQLALMLVRAGGDELRQPPVGSFCPFTDVPAFAAEAVAVAYYNGLLSGKTADKFGPYGSATRGQLAKMVYGLHQALAE